LDYTIRLKKLSLPKESRESFRLLAQNMIIPCDLAAKLENMVGFRNILVHQYQDLDLRLTVDVIENHLDDLIAFTDYILKLTIDE
jgi:uncharacterized protein YutE (UPF0331/DUF86 family)